MAKDLALAPGTPVTTADTTNAKNRNLSLSEIAGRMSDANDAVIAALGALASAVTSSIIGGSTGATDNLLLRSKGTTGRALDASVIACDDSGNLALIASLQLNTGGGLRTAQSAGNTLLIQAYDVNGAAYTTFITLTANNDPTCDLAAGVTKGGIGIAILNTNTFVQQQGFATATLTDGANIAWNLQTQQTAKVTLGGNRTLDAPTNMVDGFTYILRVIQDGTGTRTLAYASAYKFPGGTDPVLSTAAGAVDILTFVSDGTSMYGVAQKNFS